MRSEPHATEETTIRRAAPAPRGAATRAWRAFASLGRLVPRGALGLALAVLLTGCLADTSVAPLPTSTPGPAANPVVDQQSRGSIAPEKAVLARTVRINAGGWANADSQGREWQADRNFTGGTHGYSSAEIAGTDDDWLYQTERFGNFRYDFVIPNGTYAVTLKFAELIRDQPGERVFDVLIEGRTVLSNFDILAEVPKNTALDKTFQAGVSDGTLRIAFRTVVDEAKVSAIEIVPAQADATPPTIVLVSPAGGATNVWSGVNVGATFSEPMDPTSLTAATFTLVKQGTTTRLPAAVTYDPTNLTVILDPNDELESGTTYTARIRGGAGGARDLVGNSLAEDRTWSFTVADRPGG